MNHLCRFGRKNVLMATLLAPVVLVACGPSENTIPPDDTATATGAVTVTPSKTPTVTHTATHTHTETQAGSGDGVIDITNAIFTERSGDCADYNNTLEASVTDITNSTHFDADILITSDATACSFVSNSIPNHDFNDETAFFHEAVSAQSLNFEVVRNPSKAATSTALTLSTTNAILLNGVVVDILSAGCYDPTDPQADSDGNTSIGCDDTAAWLLDPLGTSHKFGADAHNAHVQPGGLYHYHGSPKAMFDDNPGSAGSPVIGFAADGYPIYGTYFLDSSTSEVRKALSGYTLKSGPREAIDGLNPGGSYDGTYVSDWEFTGAGDLDECNGMTVDGQYGYYTIESYPWIIACFSGTPHASFNKGAGGDGPPPGGP